MSLIKSTETIDFQRDGFGKDLENELGKIRTIVEKRSSFTTKDYVGINKLINDRFTMGATGSMPIDFKIDDRVAGPCCMFIPITESILLDVASYSTVDEVKKIQKKLTAKEFTVDRSKAKIGSDAEVMKLTVYFPPYFFKGNKYTNAEIAAVFLHEVGHGFTIMEYANKLCKTNQILSIALNDAYALAEPSVHQTFIRSLDKEGNLDKELLEELNNTKDKTVKTVLVMNKLVSKQSALGTLRYDKTSCEALADQFAARFGYAKDLAIALDKLGPVDEIEYMQKHLLIGVLVAVTAKYLPILLGTSSSILINALSVIVLPYATIYAVVMGILLFVLLATSDFDVDYTYDKLKIRYLRIREQLVANTKDKSFDIANIKQTVEDIKVLDDLIGKLNDKDPFIVRLIDFVFTDKQSSKAVIAKQRILEELANNDLFVKAAQLKAA